VELMEVFLFCKVYLKFKLFHSFNIKDRLFLIEKIKRFKYTNIYN
jgi:hypothetical protein